MELTWDASYQYADGTPRIPGIPGHEVSGVVERMAPDVTDFHSGDEVYGLVDFPHDGAAAEFAAVRAANLALKPLSIPHEQAAALPLSALTAWQALFEHARLDVGHSVLIHGGAGGVGSMAVQLARWRGSRVLATASPRNAWCGSRLPRQPPNCALTPHHSDHHSRRHVVNDPPHSLYRTDDYSDTLQASLSLSLSLDRRFDYRADLP